MRTSIAVRWGASISTALLLTALGSGQAAQAGNALDIVASGLNNPRGITVSDTGDIYVAEAGTGGPTADAGGTCFPNPEGGADVCFGNTGSVTKLAAKGGQSRVITGLPSLAAGGGGASGPSDVVVTGNQKLAVVIGLGADPAQRDTGPAAMHRMGTVFETFLKQGRTTTLADIAAFEGSANPIHDPDSNPVGLVRSGAGYLVADAGGNTILRTGRGGSVSLVATLADGPAVANPFAPPGAMVQPQAVPTAVAIGPDGATYVSQLTGFPFPVGGSSIWRIAADGTLSQWASGFTNVTDLTVGPDGFLYAVELATTGLLAVPPGQLAQGSLWKISPDGTKSLVAGGLPMPYGVALDEAGHTAYVTLFSGAPHAGAVAKIALG